MKRVLVWISAVLLSVMPALAQEWSATGGTGAAAYMFTPEVVTGLDKVCVFQSGEGANLAWRTSNPGDWTWYSYDKDPSTAQPVSATDVQVGAAETRLLRVQTNKGYFVANTSGSRRYCYTVLYAPVVFQGLDAGAGDDPNADLTVSLHVQAPTMYFYTVNALAVPVPARTYTLEWNTLEWNASTKSWKKITARATRSTLPLENWSIAAPLCDTYFTVSADQYADVVGQASVYTSALVKAVAVKANALAVTEERKADNEVDPVTAAEYENGAAFSGPAPLTVTFTSHPTDAVAFYEWLVYDDEKGTGTYRRYSDQDLTHTFLNSGKYLVKLTVSNATGTCKDSASFVPQVTESKLDCPNYFTPRSTPGENDEFRVAYRSLISFHGIIINRWNNVLFEWSDPAKGWDGTYKGKPVSPGVYFYLIEATGSDGIRYKKKGDINLLE
jgi:gliding motility-associated-like protein